MVDEVNNEVKVNDEAKETESKDCGKECCKASDERKAATRPDDRDYAVRSFRDMDRFMNKWIGEPFTDLLGYDPFASLSRRARVMSNGLNSMLSGNQARVYDNEDGSADVIMDMPGVNKDDIHVSYPSAYAIRVNRSRHEHDERHNEYSEYTEIIPIHAGLDVTAATAKLENGQLRIHVPVKAAGDEPDNTISID